MDEKISFSRSTALGNALFRWWEGLESHREDRAQLRRASSLTAVTLTPGFQRFYRFLLTNSLPELKAEGHRDKLAAIAAVLAHIKKGDERSFPASMRDGDKQKVSELRFRRLLESPAIDDLFVGLRRTLPLVGHAADPNKLADDIWYWGDKKRKDWAYAYPWPEKSN